MNGKEKGEGRGSGIGKEKGEREGGDRSGSTRTDAADTKNTHKKGSRLAWAGRHHLRCITAIIRPTVA